MADQDILNGDIYKADKKTLCAIKVVHKIWMSRGSPKLVDQYADILAKFVDEIRVFKDIELMLPQIANLVLHLDVSSKGAMNLEKLILVIAQNSIHTAVHLIFFFMAALEDFQPEYSNGVKNKGCNPFYFNRCSRLLQDIERAVIFGSNTLSFDEEEFAKHQGIAIDQKFYTLQTVKQQKMASKIAHEKSDFVDSQTNGHLLYKRNTRKSRFHSKSWKSRYFVIDRKILLCFREPFSVNPLRTFQLHNCTIRRKDGHPKYGNTVFELVNDSNSSKFLLRAGDEKMREKWIKVLEEEIGGAPKVELDQDLSSKKNGSEIDAFTTNQTAEQCGAVTNSMVYLSESDMNPVQRKRFNFLKQELRLVANLTDIAERLRYKERPVRKYFLRRDLSDLDLPPFSYLPLTDSLSPYTQIIRTLPAEGHAFTTKARCPALMLFETITHPKNSDIASFLGSELEKYPESQVIQAAKSVMALDQSLDENEISSSGKRHPSMANFDDIPGFRGSGEVERKEVILGEQYDKSISTWKIEGTGFRRLQVEGLKLPNNLIIPQVDPHSSSISASFAEWFSCQAFSGKQQSIAGDFDTGDTVLTTMDEDTIRSVAEVMGETFVQKVERLKQKSPYSHLPTWGVSGLIAKSNDDVRQEVFVMQVIKYLDGAFQEAELPLWLLPYTILSCSKSTGLIELIPNSSSLDGLKQKANFPGSLSSYFKQVYGYQEGKALDQQPQAYQDALENYISSMAAYSVVTYLLAIKDRHNGNIMLDIEGHIIHIDFGFVLGLAPGKAFSLEKAPWKLTKELAEVFGGTTNPHRPTPEFTDYVNRCTKALLVARKHARQITVMMEIMGFHSPYPCFQYNKNAINDFRSRLLLDLPDQEIERMVQKMVYRSFNHNGTNLYDKFQLATNGIAV